MSSEKSQHTVDLKTVSTKIVFVTSNETSVNSDIFQTVTEISDDEHILETLSNETMETFSNETMETFSNETTETFSNETTEKVSSIFVNLSSSSSARDDLFSSPITSLDLTNISSSTITSSVLDSLSPSPPITSLALDSLSFSPITPSALDNLFSLPTLSSTIDNISSSSITSLALNNTSLFPIASFVPDNFSSPPITSSSQDSLSSSPIASSDPGNLYFSPTLFGSIASSSSNDSFPPSVDPSTLSARFSTNESIPQSVLLQNTSTAKFSVDDITTGTTKTTTAVSENIFSRQTRTSSFTFTKPSATAAASTTHQRDLRTFVETLATRTASTSSLGDVSTSNILEQNSYDSVGLALALGVLGALVTVVIIAVLAFLWHRSRRQRFRKTLMKLRSVSHQSRATTVYDPPDLCFDASAFKIAQDFPDCLGAAGHPDHVPKRTLSAHEDALNFVPQPTKTTTKSSSVPNIDSQCNRTCSHICPGEDAESKADLKCNTLSKSDGDLLSTMNNNDRGSFSMA